MENKGLLKLPETWCVVVDESNKSVIENWFDTFYDNKNGIHNFEIVGISEPILDRPRLGNNVKDFGQEITFGDFKRLVLCEKNHKDYGVRGCHDLRNYILETTNVLSGGDFDFIYFYNNHKWIYRRIEKSKRQILPLTEYLKLIDKKPESMEIKQNEITIVKSMETVYFKSKNATVELTLNHEKKTFHFQIERHEMLSFKSDTIEIARERLKCIESALDYAEKHLNQ